MAQLVMYTGKEMSRNTRAVMAGLNMFCPRPPKDILAMPMATTAPMTTTHQGVLQGRFIASSRPVTSAEEPLNSSGRFIRNFAMSHSRPTQATALTARTSNSDQP